MEEGVQKLISEGRKMVTVTLGEKGCYYATKNANGRLPSYSVKVKDTTGAGDSFMGSLLYQISQSRQNITQMTEDHFPYFPIPASSQTGLSASRLPLQLHYLHP